MHNNYDPKNVFERCRLATVALASGNADLRTRLKEQAFSLLSKLKLDEFPDDIKGEVESDIWGILFPGGRAKEEIIDSLDDETCKKVATAIARITCKIAINRDSD